MALKRASPFRICDIIRKFDKSYIMSTTELKEKLITQINGTDNDELLSEISTMLYTESKSVKGVYKMSETEREAVEDGLNQIRNGQWISNEEANRQVEEWLGK
jgi:hypothetical protein